MFNGFTLGSLLNTKQVIIVATIHRTIYKGVPELFLDSHTILLFSKYPLSQTHFPLSFTSLLRSS